MNLCSEEDLKQYILADYLQAAESYNAGIVLSSIKQASREIYERLKGKYLSGNIPYIIKRICAVIASYRIISAITTIVKTESSTDNEFLPLQRLYTESMELLEKIADGKITLGNSDETLDAATYDNNAVVITNKREFNLNGY